MLLHLDVPCYNLRSELYALQFQLLILFVPPPVVLVPLTLWGLLLLYNTGILRKSSGVVFDRFRPIFWLLLYLITYIFFVDGLCTEV